MRETAIKTHLIITDIHEEYHVEWCGRIADAKPVFENGKPIFVLISDESRIELNTIDMALIERCAKRIAEPHGREAITSAGTRIYIKEENDHQMLVGRVEHRHVKQFAPMFDKVGEI